MLIKTAPPGNADTFKGELPDGWVMGLQQLAAPSLPSVCLRAKEVRCRRCRLPPAFSCRLLPHPGAAVVCHSAHVSCPPHFRPLSSPHLLLARPRPCPTPHPQDLHCAQSQGYQNVGCTACPKGRRLQRIAPRYLAGSTSLQLQPGGSACY